MGEFTIEQLRKRADRLDVLAHAVTEARWSEFYMRVPVEPERDADCVLSSAAIELRAYAALLERQAQWPSDEDVESAVSSLENYVDGNKGGSTGEMTIADWQTAMRAVLEFYERNRK